MDISIFAALFLFALVMVITPGPNNIMLLASGVNFGARKTIPHALGVILGVPILTMAVGFGLGHVFSLLPFLQSFIKLLGVIYLLYLAWKIATTVEYQSDTLGRKPEKPITLLQALLFQWVNPKAWAMVMGAIGAYTSTNIYVEIVLIALSFFCAAFISTSVWTFFGVLLNRILTNVGYRVWLNRLMGALLVLSILPMLTSSL